MQLANSLLGYLPAAIIVTLLPGPDTALVLGVATRHGVATAWRAAFGIGTGLMVWAVAVSAGLASALRASADIYAAFRWCCAVYLLYLGISAVVAARRREPREPREAGEAGEPAATQTRAWRQSAAGYRLGLLTATLNPKLGVFFVTILPQFIPRHAPVVTYTLALIALQAVFAIAWYVLLAMVAGRGQRWLRRNRVQRWINGSTAAVFTTFGIRTAFLDR
jgi:threonine/homoserine/homoserine lactone efflux protein